MAVVGTAQFNIVANPAQALSAVRTLARESQRQLDRLRIAPQVDQSKIRTLKALLSNLQKETSISVGVKFIAPKRAEVAAALGEIGSVKANIGIRLQLPKKQEIYAFLSQFKAYKANIGIKFSPPSQADISEALGKIRATKTVKINIASNAISRIADIKSRLSELKTTGLLTLSVNTSTIKALIAKLASQISELRALEARIRGLGGGGGGGGSPALNGLAESQRQLNILNSQFQRGELTVREYMNALRKLDVDTRRAASSFAANSRAALAAEKIIAGVSKAVDRLAAAQASQAAAGRSGASASAESLSRLGRELDVITKRYARGEAGLREYLREMNRLRQAGQSLAPTLAAGSLEAQKLERLMSGLSRNRVRLNDDSIVKLRSDLASLRGTYERTIASAGRFNAAGRRAASDAYRQGLDDLERRIAAVGQRANVTSRQIRDLNNITARLGSQRNALGGNFGDIGLAGNVMNALRQLPQLATLAGGALGAAATQATLLGGGLGQIAQAAGPVGIAIGAIGVAALAALGSVVALTTTGLAEIRKLQNGMNILQANGEKNLEGMRMQIGELQSSLGKTGLAFTKGDLAEATADIVKAGTTASEALELMRHSASLAAAEQVDLREASGQVLKNLRQYNMNVSEASGVTDMLAKAGNYAAGTANDLSVGFGIVGTTGSQAGIHMHELLGMLVELDNKGMSAADVGANGLRAALAALSGVSKKGEQALSALGIEIRDVSGNARPAGDIIKELGEKLRGMGITLDAATGQVVGNGNALASVSDIMDTRAAAAVLGLTGEWKKYAGGIKDSTGYSKEYADIMQQGVAPAQLRLKNAFADSGGAFVSLFAGPLTDFLDGLTVYMQQLGRFFEELRKGGAAADEFRGHVVVLLGSLALIGVALKGAAIQRWAVDALTALRLLGPQLWASIVAGVTSARTAMISLWATASGAGGLVGALRAVGTALNSVVVTGAAATAALAGVVAAGAGLALYTNKLQGDLQSTYDAMDKSSADSSGAVMKRVRQLAAENTALSRAQAKVLLTMEQIQTAQQGELKGVNWLGERIYGPVDEKRVKQLIKDLAVARQRVQELGRAEQDKAKISTKASKSIQQELRLTTDQLKAQNKTIADMKRELARPIKLFGGTDFQRQLDQVDEKYRRLRENLRETVLHDKPREEIGRQLAERQNAERGEIRDEYAIRAANAAAAAERQAQAARIAAMQEGRAKIMAQAQLDIAEIRRIAKEQARAWADFPKEKARIFAAGEAQARQVMAEANRTALAAEKKAAEKQRAEQLRRASEEARLLAKRERERKAEERRILAEKKKALAELRKAAVLERQLANLNTNFSLASNKGRVTDESLEKYRQGVERIRSEIERLPQDLQGRLAPLIGNSKGLAESGKRIAALNNQIRETTGQLGEMSAAELRAAAARYEGVAAAKNLQRAISKRLPIQEAKEYEQSVQRLKGALTEMSFAELQSRLVSERASDSQQKRVKLIENEIRARKRLRDVVLLEGRLTLRRNDAQAVVDNYEQEKANAGGDAQRLLGVELRLGAEALRARQQLAQVAAEREILQLKEAFRAKIEEARKHGTSVVELESQLESSIQQIRARRDATQLANKQNSDRALIDQTRATNDELIRLELEKVERSNDLEKSYLSSRVSRYELGRDQTGEDLVARRDYEVKNLQEITTARQDLAKRAKQAEIRAEQEKYRILMDAARDNDSEYRRLKIELEDWVANREKVAAEEYERIAWETGQALINAEKAVQATLLQIRRGFIKAAEDRSLQDAQLKADQLESQLDDELKLLGDNEGQKLVVLQKHQEGRLLLASEVARQQRLRDEAEEKRRFRDLKAQAEREGTWAQLKEQAQADHENRLNQIRKRAAFDWQQTEKHIRGQVLEQQERSAKEDLRVQKEQLEAQARELTDGLGEMSLEQRNAASATLASWLSTFRAMGEAGAEAANTIQKALNDIARADREAQARIMNEFGKILDDSGGIANLAGRLGARSAKIGKADTREDAEIKGREAYASELDSIQEGINAAQAVIKLLSNLPSYELGAAQSQRLAEARSAVIIYRQQLGITQALAKEAGAKAGLAFVRAQAEALAEAERDMLSAQDSVAEAAYAQAGITYKLEKLGDPSLALDNYNNSLREYRQYWEGRARILRSEMTKARAAQKAAQTAFDGLPSDASTEERTRSQHELNEAIAAAAQAQAALTSAIGKTIEAQQRSEEEAQKLKEERERQAAEAERQAKKQAQKLEDEAKKRAKKLEDEAKKLEDRLNESLGVVSQQRDNLKKARGSAYGVLVEPYQGEIEQLEELMEKYPEQLALLKNIRAEYAKLQELRRGLVSAETLRLDFKIGWQKGEGNLRSSISSVAEGFGELLNPLGLAASIFGKINVVGTATEAMFEVLQKPLAALGEPARLIGEIMGSILRPALEILAPIVTTITKVFATLYDVLAAFVKTITFGLVDITRRGGHGYGEEGRLAAAKARTENDLAELDALQKAGLIDTRQYQDERLRLTKERLDREREAEIRAAGDNAALIREIRRKYDLEYRREQMAAMEEVREFGNTLGGAFSGELMSALERGNFSGFTRNIRKAVGKAVLDGMLQAFVNKQIVERVLGPAAETYMATGSVAALENAMNFANGMAQKFFRDVQPIAARFGIGGISGAPNASLFGAAPDVQFGVPRFEVQFPEAVLASFGRFDSSVQVFADGGKAMIRAAKIIERSFSGNGNPPALSGNGGLV